MIKNPKKSTEKDRKIGQILGINIISTSTNELLTRVNYFLSHNTKFYIVTPNPELVLMAQDNLKLKKALNEADLPVPDGVGLNYASKFLYGKGINIIPGRQLFLDIVREINKKPGKVFLLGGMGGEADFAAGKLKKSYNKVKIESLQGPKLTKNGKPNTEVDKKLEKDAIDRINKFAPDMLFVAFGNPKQEIWINEHLKNLKIGGAMAVGGTFRYISGVSKLPPDFMDRLGLEWLWRLLTEPERFGRVINAVIIFPIRVLLSRLGK